MGYNAGKKILHRFSQEKILSSEVSKKKRILTDTNQITHTTPSPLKTESNSPPLLKIPLHNERSYQSVFQSNKLSISWFLSRRCILRSLGVNARTGLDSPFSSVVSFSNTFAIAGLSLCSLGRSLNRTCGKNRNDPYMTGAIKGLNWAKTMRYVGHHCLIPGSCGLSGSPGSPGQSWIHHPNTLTAKVSVNAEKVSILASRIMTGASGGKALQAIIPTWEKENSKDLNQRGRQRRRKLHPKIGFALFQIASLLLQLFQFVIGQRFFSGVEF